jgi:hypothetical protein
MAAKFPAVASSNGRATWYVDFEGPTPVTQESAAPLSIPTVSNNNKQRTLSPARENKINNPPSQPIKPTAAPAVVQLKSPLPTAGSSPALISLSSVDQEQSQKPVSSSKSRSVTPPQTQSPQPISAVIETISASARSASNPSMSAGVAASKPTSLPLNTVTSSTSSDAQPPLVLPPRSSRLYPAKQATPSPSPSQSDVKPIGASTPRSPTSSQPTTEIASITSPPKLLSTTPTTPTSVPVVDQSKKTAAVPKIPEDAIAPTRVTERPTSPQQQATATESSTNSKKFEKASTVATTTQRAVSPQSMSTVNQVVSNGRSNGSSNSQPALSAHNAALLSAPQPVAKQPALQPHNKQPLTRSASQEGSSSSIDKLSNNYLVSPSPTLVSQATVENHPAAAAAASATSGNSPSSSANKKPQRTSILRSISLKLTGSKPAVEKPTVELRRISRQLEEDQLPRPEDNPAKAQVIKENPVSIPVPVPHLPPKQKHQLLMASRSDGAAALPQTIRRTPVPIIARPSVQRIREPIAPPPAAVSVASTSSTITTAAPTSAPTATTATATAAEFLTPAQQPSLMVVPLIPPAQPAQQPPAAVPESADLWPQFNTPSSPLSPPATEAASATPDVESGAGKTDSLESRKKRQRAARSVSVKVAGFDKSTRLTVRPTTPPPELDGFPRNWETIMDAVVGVLMTLLSQSTISKSLM